MTRCDCTGSVLPFSVHSTHKHWRRHFLSFEWTYTFGLVGGQTAIYFLKNAMTTFHRWIPAQMQRVVTQILVLTHFMEFFKSAKENLKVSWIGRHLILSTWKGNAGNPNRIRMYLLLFQCRCHSSTTRIFTWNFPLIITEEGDKQQHLNPHPTRRGPSAVFLTSEASVSGSSEKNGFKRFSRVLSGNLW